MKKTRILAGLVGVALLGMSWYLSSNRDAAAPEFLVNALNKSLSAGNRDLWWDNANLAKKGCLLKRKTKQTEEAEIFCTRAIELAPDDPEAAYEAGMILRAKGRPLEAVPLLNKAAVGGISEAPAFLAATYLTAKNVNSATDWARQARTEKASEPYSWSVSCLIESAVFLDNFDFALSQVEVQEICKKAREMAAGDDFMVFFEGKVAHLIFPA